MLAQSNDAVIERLSGMRGMHRLPYKDLPIFFMKDFLDDEACSEIIALIDEVNAPSVTLPPSPDVTYRTSRTCYFVDGPPLVMSIERRLSDLTGIPGLASERIQGQRYVAGQQFKPHVDAFNDRQLHGAGSKSDYQRTWTVMIYLNGSCSGGETVFPNVGFKSSPRRGNLLAWLNLLDDGSVNPLSVHFGAEVTEGSKYILTKWFKDTLSDVDAFSIVNTSHNMLPASSLDH